MADKEKQSEKNDTALHAKKVDCSFVVGPEREKQETIFGHKWILAVYSPKFELMFSRDLLESEDSVLILLPEDDPETFRHLRAILYNMPGCEIETLSLDETIALYKMCEKYGIASIKKQCINQMKNNLKDAAVSQLIWLFSVCNQSKNLHVLQTEVEKKLNLFRYPLVQDLNNLNLENFRRYLELYMGPLNYISNHSQLFTAIEAYVVHHQLMDLPTDVSPDAFATLTLENNKKSYIERELLEILLSYVDFAKITITDFFAGPHISNILTLQQKYFVVCGYAENRPKPNGIHLFPAMRN